MGNRKPHRRLTVKANNANFRHGCTLLSVTFSQTSPWHIAMPSGGGTHSITSQRKSTINPTQEFGSMANAGRSTKISRAVVIGKQMAQYCDIILSIAPPYGTWFPVRLAFPAKVLRSLILDKSRRDCLRYREGNLGSKRDHDS